MKNRNINFEPTTNDIGDRTCIGGFGLVEVDGQGTVRGVPYVDGFAMDGDMITDTDGCRHTSSRARAALTRRYQQDSQMNGLLYPTHWADVPGSYFD